MNINRLMNTIKQWCTFATGFLWEYSPSASEIVNLRQKDFEKACD